MDEFNKIINRKNTNSIKWDYQAKEGQLSFAVADSDYPSPKCVLKAINKRVKHGIFGYSKLPSDYNDVIVSWYKKSHNVDIDPNYIIPTTGVLRSIKIALDTNLDFGNEVLVTTPVYNGFFHLLDAIGRKVICSEMHNNNEYYTLNYEDIETKLKQGCRFVLFCNPHNPTGRVWHKDEIKKLVDLCLKYKAILISDEIHADIVLNDNKFTSLMEFKEIYDYLYVTSAPTKTFNVAGLLSSYLIVPNLKSKKKCEEFIDKNFMDEVNIIAGCATYEAYTNPEAFEWMNKQNKHIYNNYVFARNYLLEHLDKLKISELQGTYLMWIDFKNYINDGNKLDELLKKAGVVLNKGIEYGKNYDSYMRLNIACSQKVLEKGLDIIVKTLNG